MNEFSWQCPVATDTASERVTLAYGEGSRLTRRLIEDRIRPRFANAALAPLGDAAHLRSASHRLAVSTDSYVVSPLFFPGGDIGQLAVYGTVNDLAVSGAVARWLCLSLIIEEGLLFTTLDRVLDSVAAAATRCRVEVVAGDSKVVPRGAADGLFLNTTGLGELVDPVPPGPRALRPGDVLIVSGPIGRHGMAVLSARDNLDFEPAPQSDCAPLTSVAETLRSNAVQGLRAMRDATRGGVAAVLHEWAVASGQSLHLVEREVPVTPEVRGACELLGLDPIFVACEGTLLAALAPAAAQQALAALRARPESASAAIIGEVRARGIAPVTISRTLAAEQPLDEPAGAPLPRIC